MSHFVSFFPTLLIFALCQKISNVFLTDERQHLQNIKETKKNKFEMSHSEKSFSEMSNLNSKTFLTWSPMRQERVLKKIWRNFDLNEETLIKHLDNNNIDNEENNTDSSTDNITDTDRDYQLLMIEFRAKEHFEQTLSHKLYLEKVFDKIGGRYFPNVTFSRVANHDVSKLSSFVEVVGYTDKWIWRSNETSEEWNVALKHHYDHNSHHPEFYVDQNGVKKG